MYTEPLLPRAIDAKLCSELAAEARQLEQLRADLHQHTAASASEQAQSYEAQCYAATRFRELAAVCSWLSNVTCCKAQQCV